MALNIENNQISFTVDTSTVLDPDGNPYEYHGDVVIPFERPLNAFENSTVTLINYNLFFTWSLVNDERKNNYFECIIPATGPSISQTLQIADGIYSIPQLGDAIKAKVTEISILNGGGAVGNNITFSLNETNGLVTIACQTGWALRLNPEVSDLISGASYPTYSELYKVFGFLTQKIIGATWGGAPASVTGSQHADISGDVSSYLIRNSLVDNAVYNGRSGYDILYMFGTANSLFGGELTLNPSHQIPYKISQGRHRNMRVRLTDNQLNVIELKQPISLFLLFENITWG